MIRSLRVELRALLVVCAALVSGGCNTSTCDRGEDSLTVTNDQGHRAPGSWFSANYEDPGQPLNAGDQGYQYFPPARTITFEHDLGSIPEPVVTLAFDKNGSLAFTAGNQSLIECMDDQVILIKNDTCSDFYIFVQTTATGIHQSKPKDCRGNVNPYFDAAGAAGAPAIESGEGGAAGATP